MEDHILGARLIKDWFTSHGTLFQGVRKAMHDEAIECQGSKMMHRRFDPEVLEEFARLAMHTDLCRSVACCTEARSVVFDQAYAKYVARKLACCEVAEETVRRITSLMLYRWVMAWRCALQKILGRGKN